MKFFEGLENKSINIRLQCIKELKKGGLMHNE